MEKASPTKKQDSVSLVETSSSAKKDEIAYLNARLANPLAGLSHKQLMEDGEAYAMKNGLEDLSDLFKKGALVAKDPLAFEDLPLLNEEEKQALRGEVSNKWRQPKMLYYLVILCSGKCIYS